MTRNTQDTRARATRAARPREDRLVLTAYQLPGAPLALACAGASRGWMDATDGRYAYRCLPLLIANQAGWFVLNDQPFDVLWDGTRGLPGVRIRPLDKRASPPPVASHFGEGVVTFRIPYLFRTSPGYNLLVRGPANWPKDGIQALEGLVESDWSCATFTMNWKITRPKRWIRFDAGEPVCMLVPQRRGELEAFQTKAADLTSNPELRDGHAQWAASRSRFLAELRVAKPAAVERKWQKHYFQGRSPGGSAPARQHQTVLRLQPFTPGDIGKGRGPTSTGGDRASRGILQTMVKASTLRQNPDYRLEKLGSETLLYHPARTAVLYLNETASLIWSLCNGARTAAEIAELLREAFPEQAAGIEAEVEATLRHFVEQHAVECV